MRAPDESLAFLREGYRWTPRRSTGTADVEFTTRLFGRRTIVVRGPDGVDLFYNQELLQRTGAMPKPLRDVLFGKGAVHGLDDDAHLHRKGLFLNLLTNEAASNIARTAEREWQAVLSTWPEGSELDLFATAARVLARAVCAWAGIPSDRVSDEVGSDLITIVDGFGSAGRRYLHAAAARRRCNRWAASLVDDQRAGRITAADDSPLFSVADFRNTAGDQLSSAVAGIELLNMLRPTTAVAYFIAFSIDALRSIPHDEQPKTDAELEAFAHEVRRFYPFVPGLAARARTDFEWRGESVKAGSLVVLDVYGTLHDSRWWQRPDEFDHRRFHQQPPEDGRFIPQGGGDATKGHRCPGERVAMELIKTSVRALQQYDFEIPAQNLTIPMNRMPTRPHDGPRLRRRIQRRAN